jgi:hypothetical protein
MIGARDTGHADIHVQQSTDIAGIVHVTVSISQLKSLMQVKGGWYAIH